MFDRTRLATLERGGFPEVTVQGEIAVHDGEKIIFQSYDCVSEYPSRSLLKPFQFLATGLVDKLGSDSKYVPCLGSISATSEQVEYLKKWYGDKKYSESISKLKLTPSYPADENHRSSLKNQGGMPSPFFHWCFSKHMAILEACEIHGWDSSTYYQVEHPFQKKLREVLEQCLGCSLSQVRYVTDGCKLPSPVLTLAQMAKLYQRLISAEEGSLLDKIRNKMVKHPSWIGGPDRVDTLMMQKNPGVIAKEGAEGLIGIGVPPSFNYPRGLGIVIKTWAGYQPKLAALALVPLFKAIGLKGVEEVSSDQKACFHYRPFEPKTIQCWDISPELSSEIAVWPGDKPFKRTVSFDTQKGDHMTLSSFETTFHVGAHTDATNHFEDSHLGIDQKSVATYCGGCQVIEIRNVQGRSINLEDLEGQRILSDRVLFKTNSFPNPNQFNEDFAWLSVEAIEYLSKQGVVLVGIDTPSIDSFSSKDLLAHHATTRVGISILEGIILKDVPEGIYQLSAIPLRIKGADASPVRAILTKY